MTWTDTKAADDYAEIARRMREIKDEEQVEDEGYCSACEGGGWECYGLGRGDPHFRVCTVCGNPNGHPSP